MVYIGVGGGEGKGTLCGEGNYAVKETWTATATRTRTSTGKGKGTMNMNIDINLFSFVARSTFNKINTAGFAINCCIFYKPEFCFYKLKCQDSFVNY